MKKYIVALVVALCCLAFTACGGGETDSVQRKITFTQEGCETIERYVNDGEDLTDIPQPQQKDGYTIVWSIQNFENIREDLSVEAIETPNMYKVYYEIGDGFGATISASYTDVTFDAAYELLVPDWPGYTFTGWVVTGTQNAFQSDDAYTVVGDVYLTATWTPTDVYVNPFL